MVKGAKTTKRHFFLLTSGHHEGQIVLVERVGELHQLGPVGGDGDEANGQDRKPGLDIADHPSEGFARVGWGDPLPIRGSGWLEALEGKTEH